VAVVALTIVLAITGAFGNRTTVQTSTVTTAPGSGAGLKAAALYAAANPGVVDITAHSTTTAPSGPLGLPGKSVQTDSGTGMVLDAQGRILTADHVVAGASAITVSFQDGATRKATVLGGDTGTDVAVLKVDASGLTLHPLALGTLAGHRVGDPLAVIGDPFDVQRSLSTGVISGLDRTIQAPNGFSIPHALQTDAAMNPGNSGGPVFDASGHVVGIADQIATGSGGGDSSTGVGFAVPIDVIKPELAPLEAGTTPAHAYLGLAAGDATSANHSAGALVQTIQPSGPSARAGLRPGDRIVGLGTAKVASVNDLIAATATHRPGQTVAVTVIRAGKQVNLKLTLAKEPTTTSGG
jgi:S1-C subfamily serine protease